MYPSFLSPPHHDPYTHLSTFLLTILTAQLTSPFLPFRLYPSGLPQKGFCNLLLKSLLSFMFCRMLTTLWDTLIYLLSFFLSGPISPHSFSLCLSLSLSLLAVLGFEFRASVLASQAFHHLSHCLSPQTQ
jgi:hypothetical protein